MKRFIVGLVAFLAFIAWSSRSVSADICAPNTCPVGSWHGYESITTALTNCQWNSVGGYCVDGVTETLQRQCTLKTSPARCTACGIQGYCRTAGTGNWCYRSTRVACGGCCPAAPPPTCSDSSECGTYPDCFPCCTPGTWVNDSCGWNNNCETDEMRQTKTDDPVDCSPPSEQCVADPSCRPPVCQSSSIDDAVLKDTPLIEITISGEPPESTINYFLLAFYNKDNPYPPPPDNNPKPIYFTDSTHYQRVCNADAGGSNCSISADKETATFTLSYDELHRPDLNWGGDYPINIQVNGYFGLTDGGFSQADGNCVQSFTVATPACSVSLDPASGGSVAIGREILFTAYVDAPGWNIDKVDFFSGDMDVATVDPSFVLTTVSGQTVYRKSVV